MEWSNFVQPRFQGQKVLKKATLKPWAILPEPPGRIDPGDRRIETQGRTFHYE